MHRGTNRERRTVATIGVGGGDGGGGGVGGDGGDGGDGGGLGQSGRAPSEMGLLPGKGLPQKPLLARYLRAGGICVEN